MAAIRRRSLLGKIPASVSLADADDLNGTSDGTQHRDVSGASRVLIVQHNNGTLGTAGIDVIEVSHDGGTSWAADDTILALASDDATGTVLANAALNAAGVEPVNMAIFKCGPFAGPTLIRCTRDATRNANSAAWVTGAPSVTAITIGR
jgi:hypothetical protein